MIIVWDLLKTDTKNWNHVKISLRSLENSVQPQNQSWIKLKPIERIFKQRRISNFDFIKISITIELSGLVTHVIRVENKKLGPTRCVARALIWYNMQSVSKPGCMFIVFYIAFFKSTRQSYAVIINDW